MNQYKIYRAKIDENSGAWTREYLGTIEAADQFEAGLAAKEKFGANFDGTSHNNTMLGDLRVFGADEKVQLSGTLSKKAATKYGKQWYANQKPWNR